VISGSRYFLPTRKTIVEILRQERVRSSKSSDGMQRDSQARGQGDYIMICKMSNVHYLPDKA